MSDVSPSATPERILQSVWAFAPPLAIEAAIRHRVFDVLTSKSLSLPELEQATGASARGLSAIANLLVGLSLLTCDQEGRYALTPESEAFLVTGKPSFVGGIFRHMSSQLLPKWLQLSEVVGSGKPAAAVNSIEEGAPFFAEFVEDILPLSYPSACNLAKALCLADATTPVSVLDLASGSGVWGIALAQASPLVSVRAVDWADVLPVTRRMAQRFGVGDRFSLVAGDLLEADFGHSHQVATLGHILHSEGVERSRALLRRTHAALAPGGTVAIAEFLVDEDRPSEWTDFRSEHAREHRSRQHLLFRRDRRLADRGGFQESASIARAWSFATDPCDTRLMLASPGGPGLGGLHLHKVCCRGTEGVLYELTPYRKAA